MMGFSEEEAALLVAACYACGQTFCSHPSTVDVILIDQETNLPIQYGVDGEGKPFIKPGGPSASDKVRAMREPVCPSCTSVIKARGFHLRVTPRKPGDIL